MVNAQQLDNAYEEIWGSPNHYEPISPNRAYPEGYKSESQVILLNNRRCGHGIDRGEKENILQREVFPLHSCKDILEIPCEDSPICWNRVAGEDLFEVPLVHVPERPPVPLVLLLPVLTILVHDLMTSYLNRRQGDLGFHQFR